MREEVARGLAGAIAAGLGGGIIMLSYRLLTWKDPFDYDRKSLKGGYICRICGKPILGKETQHTEEDCKAYRSRPKKPDHSVFHGAQKYVRMPDYAMVKEVKA